MALIDILSIAFIVILLTSVMWPFIRSRMRRFDASVTGGPRGFFESGGYVRTGLSAAQQNPGGEDDFTTVQRDQMEERLTRNELVERGYVVRPSMAADDASVTSSATPLRRRERSPQLEKLRAQFASPESAQLALLTKEVFDRPVGMRNDG